MSASTEYSRTRRAMSKQACVAQGQHFVIETSFNLKTNSGNQEAHGSEVQLLQRVILMKVHADVEHEALENLMWEDLQAQQAPQVSHH
eukprot:CAMPEP_0180667180 /NCGR_PEP_ID=MMETSP1037_2-20121125/62236_1 /TAXON_ID=632150 /ORGANISM="Azadinium spinosum, Strain 3D9" /LENGTH=87 /DNA_ID=CAMNT_0022695789 /DNA_START=198 /DNA_END=459 /DNA_ORIENTATION=-